MSSWWSLGGGHTPISGTQAPLLSEVLSGFPHDKKPSWLSLNMVILTLGDVKLETQSIGLDLEGWQIIVFKPGWIFYHDLILDYFCEWFFET